MKLHALLSAAVLTFAVGTARAQNAEDDLRICDGSTAFCDSSQQQFKTWFPRAYQKDYQGQRNVSFCLTDGCDGAVQVNKPLGCAWRFVILASGSPKVDSTDTGFFDSRYRKFSEGETLPMKSQADALFRQIYKKPLPKRL
jgi:hypothetical protein